MDFALAQPRQDYILLANRGINSLAHLKGKKIGVQDTTGVNYAQALLVLQKAGLSQRTSRSSRSAGRAPGSPRWWRAGSTRRCSATRPRSRWPARASRRSSTTPRKPRTSTTTTSSPPKDWLAKHKDLAVSLNKALLDSFEWFDDPANADAVVTEALAIQPQPTRTRPTVFDQLRQVDAYPTGTILDPDCSTSSSSSTSRPDAPGDRADRPVGRRLG